MDGLDTLKAKYLTAVAAAADESALEEVRLAALGKKGEISAMMATLGKMDPDARKAAGAQQLTDGDAEISWQNAEGEWIHEHADGADRPMTDVVDDVEDDR